MLRTQRAVRAMGVAAKVVARYVQQSIYRQTNGWIYSVQGTMVKHACLVDLAIAKLDPPCNDAHYHHSGGGIK